jgi:transposase
VERFLGFLRHSFFAARTFSSVTDLNAQLARWIAEVAHARLVPGRRDQSVIDLPPVTALKLDECRSGKG